MRLRADLPFCRPLGPAAVALTAVLMTALPAGAEPVSADYQVYFGGNFLAPFRVYRFDEPSQALLKRADAYLSQGGDGELTEMFSFAPGETHEDMPRHVRAFMRAYPG